MNVTEAELLSWVSAFIWPLVRIGALFLSAPIFSLTSVPARVRVILAVALTFAVIPMLPPSPDIAMFSYQGMAVTVQQTLIGVATGFILQTVFAAVNFAGQGMAYSMGLGFSLTFDPQNGGQSLAVGQFYVTLMSLIFFSMDGHLLLLKMLLDSFKTLPIGLAGVDKDMIWTIIRWGGQVFAGGLLLAMPMMTTLLLINVCFGVATRAAPQMNIFSVGLPVTIVVGLLLMWATLSNTLEHAGELLNEAYDLTGQLLKL